MRPRDTADPRVVRHGAHAAAPAPMAFTGPGQADGRRLLHAALAGAVGRFAVVPLAERLS